MFPHASVFPSKTQVVFKTFVHFKVFSNLREKRGGENEFLEFYKMLLCNEYMQITMSWGIVQNPLCPQKL